MQRRQFASPIHPAPPAGDEGDAWSVQEFPCRQVDETPPRLSSAGFVLAMIATGMALAVVWHFTDLLRWSVRPLWTTLAAPSVPSVGKPASEDPLARIVRDLDALKNGFNNLGASQQQIAASIATLQASQQDLRQRFSSIQAGLHWYSDVAALRLRFVIQQGPAPVASASRPPISEQVARRSEGGPLPLLGPTR